MQVIRTSFVTSCFDLTPLVISFWKCFHLTRLLNAPLFFIFPPRSFLCGFWRIFRGRWLQVASATTSRNPLSLPRQPSPSFSHPLLSLSQRDSIRESENESEGREKGYWLLWSKKKGGGVPKQKREKRWYAFWWLYLMARARTCQMKIWPWLKMNSFSFLNSFFLFCLFLLSFINDKTIQDVVDSNLE